MKVRSLRAGAILCAALLSAPFWAQPAQAAPDTVTLAGNTRPEARLANDRGALPRDFRLDHMQLLLKRQPQTEAALEVFIESLHDPASPNYHAWLNAEEFGAKFGPSEADIGVVIDWLTANGFTVNGISTGRMTIDFSGTAGQVSDALHTEIHRLNVRGVAHIANMSDPQIPAAFASTVAGVVSLSDFRPHTNFRRRPAYTVSSLFGDSYSVVPADLATIYNFNPLFAEGITGKGQTVVVIEDTDVYSTADWSVFRSTFGLSSYSSGSFIQVHPTGSNACAAPGVVPDNELEAELDAEWASAAAPDAKIELTACADTTTTFGGLLALQNLIDAASPPAIVSISYGLCEALNGSTANAAYKTTYQQAVARGISVFVAAGDEGGASCDADQPYATHGIGVNAFASTPYNVAVGGTDYGDTYAGTLATYWNASNGSTYGSAKSYIPEIPWNSSCGSVLSASYFGYATTYGSSGFCNSDLAEIFYVLEGLYLTTGSGSGGPSKCATGRPSISGVVSGTCAGYPKPSWQSALGVPADGVRDIPDVSLFAADGAWGHYYVFCDSDTSDGGTACTGAPSGWTGAGGTSFASPIMAGIQALVNQKTGKRGGNPNPVYYRLAATEYGKTGSAGCNSRNGKAISKSCVFYDVTLGDIDVDCEGNQTCYLPSGSFGVLSTSDSRYQKVFGAATGWDFATGIGTVNVTNLVNRW